MLAWNVSILSLIYILLSFSTLNFIITKVQSVDELVYQSFFAIINPVLHVLSFNNNLILNLAIDFEEQLVKFENLLQ